MAGRPRAGTQIVPAQDVLDNQAIHTEKWTLYSLGNATTDSDNILKWLAVHLLIKNLLHCVPCNEEYRSPLCITNCCSLFFFFMCMRFLFYLNNMNKLHYCNIPSLDCVYHLFFVNVCSVSFFI